MNRYWFLGSILVGVILIVTGFLYYTRPSPTFPFFVFTDISSFDQVGFLVILLGFIIVFEMLFIALRERRKEAKVKKNGI